MAAEATRIQCLLEKFSKNQLDEVEFNELCGLLKNEENEAAVRDSLTHDMQAAPFTELDPAMLDAMLAKINGKEKAPVRTMYPWRRIVAAAAIIIAIVCTAYLLFSNPDNTQRIAQKQTPVQHDIAPGMDGAVLTLADGKQIVLEQAANGKITDVAEKQGNTISYANADADALVFNTITTPRGRQFALVLEDGSKVWLNAASSIRFPVAFTTNERRLEITGEAYFEVAHNAAKPFHVTVNGMDVRVLGTHFNINAYNDEASIKTTLLEGSVKVSYNNSVVQLRPGQQSVAAPGQALATNQSPDLDAVMAWKNGYFSFNDADIETVMRQVERWYDVDVVYNGAKPSGHFAGKTSRNLNASQMLKVIELSGVKVKIEGKKIFVSE